MEMRLHIVENDILDLKYNIVEIFKSIEGEGIRAGYLVTFIRFGGCNLRCKECDTKYSYNEYSSFTLQEIVDKLQELECNKITVTGGEPLIQDNVDQLLTYLSELGYEINIETNGSVSIEPFKHLWNTFFTLDYKCPSTGMEKFMIMETNNDHIGSDDVLKFVVADENDLDTMKNIYQNYYPSCNVYVSPMYGKIDSSEIVEYLKDNKLDDIRIQIQLHKIIYDVNERGV